MPGKKNSGADSESPAKKMKGEASLWTELAAERLKTAENILEFNEGKQGEVFRSRVRVVCGDAGKVLRECKGVAYWMWRDKRVQVLLCHCPLPHMKINKFWNFSN